MIPRRLKMEIESINFKKIQVGKLGAFFGRPSLFFLFWTAIPHFLPPPYFGVVVRSWKRSLLPRISELIATSESFCSAKPSFLSQSQRSDGISFGNQTTSPMGSSYPGSMPTRCLLKCQLASIALRRSPSSCRRGAVRCYGRSAISFGERKEVQKVLFDYLHETSALGFLNAEYISKNCPRFVNKLIAGVSAADGPSSDEEEVGRSIRKQLLYDPLNEFEPFFESLGLEESEISQVLPSYENLLSLGDHETLLKNYNTLFNYGISRRSIGRMFVKDRTIFEWEASELTARLQAYEELGLGIPFVINLAFCYPRMLVDQDCAYVFRRLTDLGFGEKWITRSLLDDNTSYQWGKGMQILDFFLNEMGCSEEDVRVLIRNHPLFLFNDSEKKVHVATAILTKLGMKMDSITSLLLQSPHIMSGSFLNNLYLSIRFLYVFGMREGEIASILCSHPDSMGGFQLKAPEKVRSDPQELCDLIRKDPRQLVEFARHDIHKKRKATALAASENLGASKFLLKLGFVENSDEMEVARKRLKGSCDDWNRRLDVLLDAGLGYQDARHLVKSNLNILNLSTDNIETKVDYLVNCLGYPIEKILSYPVFLYTNQKTLQTRVSMIQSLKGKDLGKPKLNVIRLITRSTKLFEKLFAKLCGQD